MFGMITRKTRSRQWYVDSVNGSDLKSGRSPNTALATIAKAVSRARSRDTIHLFGVFDEPVVVPVAKSYLSFIGEEETLRMAEWGYTTDAGTLVTVRAPGTTFRNIYFRPPEANGIGISLDSSGSNEARYAVIQDCRFQGRTGSYYAIKSDPDTDNVTIKNNVFAYMNTATHGTAIYAIGDAAAAPGTWEISGNSFLNGLRHVYGDFRSAVIKNNIFLAVGIDTDGGALTATTCLNTTVGGFGYYNAVVGNQLGGDYAESVYKAGTSDQWEGNFAGDTSEAEVGDNAITIAEPAA